MARLIEKLNTLKVKHAGPGAYADGNNLYLQVTKTGAKSWLFRYMRHGAQREMGLGPLRTVGLAEARARAAEARKMLLDGQDPLESRQRARQLAAVQKAKATLFKAAAEACIDDRKASWSNEKHAKQWSATLETYAYPIIGKHAVGEIDLNSVVKVLKPIWETRSETASRVRQRIETVLDYAMTKGWRTGENPARWGGNLENIFPKKGKIWSVQHHRSLAWPLLPAFIKELVAQDGSAAKALLLTILTACRTGEVISAEWNEFDLDENVWTIPAARMKARREHRIPLPAFAIDVLKAVLPAETGDETSRFVFPGNKKNSGLSNMALLEVLRRMGRTDITTHGFRSTFRVWAAEQTDFPAEVVEAALAHTVLNKVEAAYKRTDFFDRRRALMEQWAFFCITQMASEDAFLVAKHEVEFV
jgi:integrase